MILVILLICLIPINFQSIRTLSTHDSDLETSQADNLRYDFKKNIIDTSNKTKINLRHNDLITGDYNGTYGFANDTIGSIPMGWINVSTNNAKAQISGYNDGHNKVLNLKVIDNGDAVIKQIFDDGEQISGSIEFWISTTDADYFTYIMIFDNNAQKLNLRIATNKFQWYTTDWQDLDITPLDNIWYHIRLELNCITDSVDIYINDYYEGNFAFQVVLDNFDELRFNLNNDEYYETNIDAIGYSWSSNYTLNENKYPDIQIVDSNIFSKDKYEFNFDSMGNPYVHYETNISGWTIVNPIDSYLDEPSIHYRYHPESIKDEVIEEKNAILTTGYPSGAGIKNDTLGIYNDKINISFGINFYLTIFYLEQSFNVSVKCRNNNEIIKIGFDPVFVNMSHTYDILDMYYYDGIAWQFLERFHKVKYYNLYQFNLYLDNFNVKLSWYKDGIYNNSYTFPFIIERMGVNSINFLNYDVSPDVFYQFIRLCYVGIYQYDISLTKEFGCIRYNFDNIWNFNTCNLFDFISNDFTKKITYIYQESYECFNISNHFTQSIFYNIYEVEIKPYTNLWIITNNTINLNELSLSIEGIRLEKYINSVFDREITIKYLHVNLNINQSYYYIDNSNRLHYRMEITQNDTSEYMFLYFDFLSGISSNNMSIYFKCRELSINKGYPYIAMTYYQPPDNHFDLYTYPTTINTMLLKGKEFRRFHFVITDQDNNNYTGFTSEGYLYGLQFNYVPFGILPTIDVITLSLLAIIIPLIVILCPTFAIHAVYKKKEAIIPMLILFSIIAFATSLIPFQVFFIIMIALGCGALLQYKSKGGI